MIRTTLACLLLALVTALSACASSPYVLTTEAQEARKSAESAQKTADDYRRAGAHDAAPQAQARADAYSVEAQRKPSSFVEWVVDALLRSWLNSGPKAS